MGRPRRGRRMATLAIGHHFKKSVHRSTQFPKSPKFAGRSKMISRRKMEILGIGWSGAHFFGQSVQPNPPPKKPLFQEEGGAVHTFLAEMSQIHKGKQIDSRNTEFFIRRRKNPALLPFSQKSEKRDQPPSSTFWPKRAPKRAQKGPKPRPSIELTEAKRPPQSGPPFFGQKWPQKISPKKGAAFWGCRGVLFGRRPKKSPRLPKTQTPDFLGGVF